MQKKTLKIILTASILVGIILASANFTNPHTSLVQKPIQVTIPNYHLILSIGKNESVLSGNTIKPPLQPTSVLYYNLPPVNFSKGQTVAIRWYSDIFLGVYLFTQEQFTHFKEILPNMQGTGNTPDAKEWADKNEITYQAIGWAKRNGIITYNVTQSGEYVAVITNAMYGQAYAVIWEFDEYTVTYTYETQYIGETVNDNLYLYIGIIFLTLGIVGLTIPRVRNR